MHWARPPNQRQEAIRSPAGRVSAKTVAADATPCLEREYEAYNKALNSGDSTDKAFATHPLSGRHSAFPHAHARCIDDVIALRRDAITIIVSMREPGASREPLA